MRGSIIRRARTDQRKLARSEERWPVAPARTLPRSCSWHRRGLQTRARKRCRAAHLTVTATEYRLDAPDTVPAGLTTLRLVTRGKLPHQMALLRIGGGKTFADFMTAIRQPGAPAAWVSTAGGVNPPRPGGTAEVTMDLEPGTYAILCFLLAPDGVPQ